MKAPIYAGCIAAALLLSNCNSNDSTTATGTGDSLSTTTTRMDTTANSSVKDNSMVTTTVTDEKTITFVKAALAGGMEEVEMGNMAVQNAASKRVKDFGQMMVTDHTAAGNELKGLAAANHIMAPASLMPEQQKDVDKMKGMTGAAFDKAYMDMMLEDHKKDIAEFKKASTDLGEVSYKNYAAKTLPVLQKHLDSAMSIAKAVKMK